MAVSKMASKLLGLKLYLFYIHLKNPGDNPLRGKIDLIASILSTTYSLLETQEDLSKAQVKLGEDKTTLEELEGRLEHLEGSYNVDMETKAWIAPQREKIEIELKKIYKALEGLIIRNNLLDISMISPIKADMGDLIE